MTKDQVTELVAAMRAHRPSLGEPRVDADRDRIELTFRGPRTYATLLFRCGLAGPAQAWAQYIAGAFISRRWARWQMSDAPKLAEFVDFALSQEEQGG